MLTTGTRFNWARMPRRTRSGPLARSPLVGGNAVKDPYSWAYLACYFLLIFNSVLSQSQIADAHLGVLTLKAMRWALLLGFAALSVKRGRIPNGGAGAYTIAFLLAAITAFTIYTGKISLLTLSLVIISSFGIKMSDILGVHMGAILLGIALVVLCSLCGILDLRAVAKGSAGLAGFLGRENDVRYTLGFTHHNIIPILLLYMYLYAICLMRDAYRVRYDALVVALNYTVYALCGSRACILLIIVAVIMRGVCARHERLFADVAFPTCVVLLTACVLFSTVVPLTGSVDSPVVMTVDRLITSRVSLERKVMNLFPPTLWGYGSIDFEGFGEYLALDNGYVTVLEMHGIIGLVVLLAHLLYLMLKKGKCGDSYLLLFLLIMVTGNLIDNSLLHYVTYPVYIAAYNAALSDTASRLPLGPDRIRSWRAEMVDGGGRRV